MKVIQTLKHLINFSFLVFIILAFLVLILPLFMEHNEQDFFWRELIYLGVHMGIIFMILFYLRKFVINSADGNPLDKSTRNSLMLTGIFCLIYGVLKIFQYYGFISFYMYGGELSGSLITLITSSFYEFGSLCFTFLIGLFFIYLSKVLELSDVIKQENQLTI